MRRYPTGNFCPLILSRPLRKSYEYPLKLIFTEVYKYGVLTQREVRIWIFVKILSCVFTDRDAAEAINNVNSASLVHLDRTFNKGFNYCMASRFNIRGVAWRHLPFFPLTYITSFTSPYYKLRHLFCRRFWMLFKLR